MKTERGLPACLPRRARWWCDMLTRSLRLACACTLAACPVCLAAQTQPIKVPAPAPAPSETKPAIPPRSILLGVPNFGQATPTLYRGGQPNREGFTNLRKLGIDIVVDLRGSRAGERRVVTGLGMKYVAIHWHCYSQRDEVFAQFLSLLRENPGKKVFVHCKVGDDRTGMDIAAYRIAEQGWTAEEAMREMEVYGVNWFHRTICPRLESYERDFPRRFETSPAFRELRSGEHAPQP